MQLELLVHCQGNMVYRATFASPDNKDAHQQVVDDLPNVLAYLKTSHGFERITSYQITVKEIVQDDDVAKWMEMPL